jgi:hypothetical protein
LSELLGALVGFIERFFDAEVLLHFLGLGEFLFGEFLTLFGFGHVLGQLIEGFGGLLLGFGGLLQVLGLGLAGLGLRGLLEVLGDLRSLLLHLGEGGIGRTGHLALLIFLQVGRIGFLSEGGLQRSHFFRVLSGGGFEGGSFFGDFSHGFLCAGFGGGGLGLLLGLFQIFGHGFHHVADLRSELREGLTSGFTLRSDLFGDFSDFLTGLFDGLLGRLLIEALARCLGGGLLSELLQLLGGVSTLIGSLLGIGGGLLVRLLHAPE